MGAPPFFGCFQWYATQVWYTRVSIHSIIHFFMEITISSQSLLLGTINW